jgi:carboxypeptidase D
LLITQDRYSIGTPKVTNEEESAQDFIKFFKNFEVLFGIKKFKIYVAGESYAVGQISFLLCTAVKFTH